MSIDSFDSKVTVIGILLHYYFMCATPDKW